MVALGLSNAHLAPPLTRRLSFIPGDGAERWRWRTKASSPWQPRGCSGYRHPGYQHPHLSSGMIAFALCDGDIPWGLFSTSGGSRNHDNCQSVNPSGLQNTPTHPNTFAAGSQEGERSEGRVGSPSTYRMLSRSEAAEARPEHSLGELNVLRACWGYRWVGGEKLEV